METKISTALHAAVECMPKELCSLIAGYAAANPHRWNAAGLSGVGCCTATTTGNDETGTTELKIVEQRGESANRWHTFVSEVPFAAGTDVVVEFSNRFYRDGWIGFGMTTAECNKSSAPDKRYSLMAGKVDYVLYEISDRWFFINDHKAQATPIRLTYHTADCLRVWFSADKTNGVVRIRIAPAGLDDTAWTLSSFNIDAPFASLRPCVVMAGPIAAVVRSGPAAFADFPTKSIVQEIVVSSVVG